MLFSFSVMFCCVFLMFLQHFAMFCYLTSAQLTEHWPKNEAKLSKELQDLQHLSSWKVKVRVQGLSRTHSLPPLAPQAPRSAEVGLTQCLPASICFLSSARLQSGDATQNRPRSGRGGPASSEQTAAPAAPRPVLSRVSRLHCGV